MPTVLIAIIAVTVIISLIGFSNPAFFEKFKFNVAGVQRGEYIRLLSAGFLHADIGHLFFNMLTLYFFAPNVIENFGDAGFLTIYFGSMLLGNLFSLFLYKRQGFYSAIGASGGVSGILFAAIALFPFIGIYFYFIPVPIPGFVFGLLYFGYSVYMMLNPRQHDNTGHAAHLGGAFFGLVYAVVMAPEKAMENGLYLAIMALPLAYMAYMVFVRKKIG